MTLQGLGYAFAFKQLQGGSEAIIERQSGGVRCLATCEVALIGVQVEVEAGVLDGLRSLPCLLTGGNDQQSWRAHEGFLRAGEDDIEAPFIHGKRHGTEARDGIDDDEGAMFSGFRSNLAHGVEYTGAGFVMLQADGLDGALMFC